VVAAPSVLDRLPPELRSHRLIGVATSSAALGSDSREKTEQVLPLGIDAIDSLLPGGGLPQGAVVELVLQSPMALGTTLALKACGAAQRAGGSEAWCGFVDPSETLHAPGVAALGVDLDRLLVVRPPLEVLSRVVLRMAESRLFSMLVIDTTGTPHLPLDVHLGPWVRVVRRLSLGLQSTGSIVLLITDRSAPRSLPLPVAGRIELHRPSEQELILTVTKDPKGRRLPSHRVAVGELRGSPCPRERPGLSSPQRRRMAGAA
jgi:hypothetical protein